ncbi:MAG: phosphate/phosphite/phosphonate ABC transporter substrate-binding protein [Lentisphaerae bacterium]|nr:phosphate/phosphite/phosphonate ABC transporter substrate-binding protein [Lentisphaerota bacterium]
MRKSCHKLALGSAIPFAAAAAGLIALLAAGAGCGKESLIRIDPARIETLEPKTMPDAGILRVALGAVLTPSEGFAYYQQLLAYVGTRLGRRIVCVEKTNYAEVNALLKAGEVDCAFVCSRPYVEGKDDFGLELLVAPQMYGKAEYYSYIIVPADSPAAGLADLKGKIFAFSDPLSNTGKLAPSYALGLRGETPDTFFAKHLYTHAHDKTIMLVAERVVDGGAVDSLVWEYGKRKQSRYVSRTRIIERLGPYGIPPVVVRKDLDPATKTSLREIFLAAHADKRGAEALAGMAIDRFVEIDDRAYDSIRLMKASLARQSQDQ